MIEWLINNINVISLACLALGMGLTAFYHGFEVKTGGNLADIITAGFWAGGIPIGIFFLYVAFHPEQADKLGEFRAQLVIFGSAYIYYAISNIKEILAKK